MKQVRKVSGFTRLKGPGSGLGTLYGLFNIKTRKYSVKNPYLSKLVWQMLQQHLVLSSHLYFECLGLHHVAEELLNKNKNYE